MRRGGPGEVICETVHVALVGLELGWGEWETNIAGYEEIRRGIRGNKERKEENRDMLY